ncbi:MAG: hypothetical protein GY862_01825 [Gammaproteobacteria bacterium]|nr:hypothetical protein [Gammaproteobacteria bacterium]
MSTGANGHVLQHTIERDRRDKISHMLEVAIDGMMDWRYHHAPQGRGSYEEPPMVLAYDIGYDAEPRVFGKMW